MLDKYSLVKLSENKSGSLHDSNALRLLIPGQDFQSDGRAMGGVSSNVLRPIEKVDTIYKEIVIVQDTFFRPQ